jgi:SAM-dependent methyltransferase
MVRSFDLETGRKNWEYDTLSIIATSPMIVDGRAYVMDGDDEMFIFDLRSGGRKRRPYRRIGCGESGYSSPVFVRGTLYLTCDHHLTAIRGSTPALAPEIEAPTPRGRAPDAQYVPTPPDVVQAMLQLAALREGDLLYDLGSGDGRILLAAARTAGVTAVGVEIDRDLVEESRQALERERHPGHLRVEHGDLLKADFSAATVVTLYVGTRLNGLLAPKLRALKPGSRVVSHDFEVPGLACERVLTMTSAQDAREHRIFLYRIGAEK